MSEHPSDNLNGLEVELARQIDAVCRRFEADWRGGEQLPVDHYLAEVSEEGRPALRSELEALERELGQSGRVGPSEAPTIAPGSLPTSPVAGLAVQPIHEEATLPPRDEDAINLGRTEPAQAEAGSPSRVRYFGDYEIVRELARGGMGVVFQARQVSLNRPVALKMILAGQLADDDAVRRFHIEAEAAANLDHPGIVPIYEVGEYEGQHYFSMGFVEGQSLSQKIANGPLPPRLAAELMVKVSEAIEYAHHHGVIHRDLKPANILLDQAGNPRVTDFGLAKKLEGDSGLTGSGQIMGTPSYMPPEQAGGPRGEVGPLADVYALGATLYALVTGRPPFQASTAMDTVLQVMSDDPVPPRRLNVSVPLDVETICLRCLEKEPRRRYSSARALADELTRYLSGEPILARPVGTGERMVKWVRRRPVIAGLVASVMATSLIGLSGILWQWRVAVAARVEAQRQAQIARDNEREALTARSEAQRQAQIARDNEREALAARSEAQRQAQIARDEAEFANRRLYDVKMNMVQRAWEEWSPAMFFGTLDEQRSEKQGGIDRRGFEWFYWQHKVASGHRTFKGHTNPVWSVAFSPDGKRLASGGGIYGQPGELKIWDTATGQEILSLKGHGNQVHGVAFSPDGERLASASGDLTVRLWNAETGRLTRTFHGHTMQVNSVVFSPDGKWLASASNDKTVRLWNAETGQQERVLQGHTNTVNNVVFSPDGKWLASASWDGTSRLWDIGTGQEIRILYGHSGGIVRVAFSPDGKRLASGSKDSMVRVWDAASGQETLTLKGHNGWVQSVAFSRDGKWIASGGADSTVKVWDAVSGKEIHTLKGHGSMVARVAFSPDGDQLASASWDETAKLWDAASGREIRTFKGHKGPVNGVAFSPDGKRLATASYDRTVKVWDVATGRETLTLKGSREILFQVAFSPDGKQVAGGGGNGTLKVWDATTGREMHDLKGHRFGVLALAFSPDHRRLVSGGGDQTMRIWDTVTGQEILTNQGNNAGVLDLAFSLDGKRLAVAYGDQTVKVWDAREVTPELLDQEEARGLILALIDGSSNEADLQERIDRESTRSAGVRAAASEMVRGSWPIWVRPRAEAMVGAMFARMLVREDVLAAIQARPASDRDLQAVTLKLAETWPESDLGCNNAGFALVRDPGQPEASYQRGLRLAQTACRISPRNGSYLNTLGVAQYRTGSYAEALLTLVRSDQINSRASGESEPSDLAFLAMAQHRLGQDVEARRTLARLREVMKSPQRSGDKESKAFLAEAEARIESAKESGTSGKPRGKP